MAYAASADMCIKAVNPILPFNYILHQRYEFFIRCTFYLSYMLTSQKCMNNLLIPIFVVLFLIIFPLISFTTVKDEHFHWSKIPFCAQGSTFFSHWFPLQFAKLAFDSRHPSEIAHLTPFYIPSYISAKPSDDSNLSSSFVFCKMLDFQISFQASFLDGLCCLSNKTSHTIHLAES